MNWKILNKSDFFFALSAISMIVFYFAEIGTAVNYAVTTYQTNLAAALALLTPAQQATILQNMRDSLVKMLFTDRAMYNTFVVCVFSIAALRQPLSRMLAAKLPGNSLVESAWKFAITLMSVVFMAGMTLLVGPYSQLVAGAGYYGGWLYLVPTGLLATSVLVWLFLERNQVARATA